MENKPSEIQCKTCEKKAEPPKEMMVLYDYLHEQHIATAAQIKVKQGIYKI